MKKNILLVGALLGTISINAQVKTNLNISQNSINNQTAFLDASSTVDWNGKANVGKGLVFPRTDLTALATMVATPNGLPTSYPNRLDGMVVYNTATGTSKIGNVAVKPGFYYYENKTTNINGGTWKSLGGEIGTFENIYTTNGTLSGHRTVDMGSNNLMFNGAGNVGIGTTAPTAKLDVAGNIRVQTPGGRWESAKTGTGGITSSTKLTNNYHPFLRQETLNGHFANIGGIGDNFGIYAITAEQTANATTGQLVMNTATGNVAIGQINPDANAKLTVRGGIRAAKGDTSGDTSNVGYAFDSDGDTGMFAVGGEGTASGSNLILKHNNRNALAIVHSSANVGINTTSPTQKLEVEGNIRANGGFMSYASNNEGGWIELANTTKTEGKEVNRWRIYNMTGKADGSKYTNGLHFWAYAADGTNLSSQMVLTDAGNLGIGFMSNPASPQTNEKLEVNGSIRSTALAGTGNRNVVADANGKLVIGETAVPIRTVTANTTLTAGDNNGYVYVDAAGATTVTIPATLPAGFSCIIVQQGAGQVTIAGNGVTLQTARGTKTRTRYSAVGVIKRTTDTATITGDAVN